MQGTAMRMKVLRHLRLGLVRSAAVLSLAAAAGCSGDAVRFQDGFYTGAVPPGAVGNVANVDQVATGSIQRPTGDMSMRGRLAAPAMEASTGYGAPTASVTRSSLPLPPAPATASIGRAAAYQPLPEPERVSSASLPAAATRVGEPVGTSSAAAPVREALAERTKPAATAVPRARPAGWHEGPAGTPKAAVASATEKPAARTASMAAANTEKTEKAEKPAVRTAGANTVTVEQGDSLNSIAKRAGVSVADLRSANGLASDNIRVGQPLNVPAKSATRVASLDGGAPTVSASPKAPKPHVAPTEPKAPGASQPAAETAQAPVAPTTAEAVDKEEVASVAPRSTGIDAFRWPVSGRVVKGFGDKVGSRRNDGVNISVPRGTAVKAAENGVVIYAGEGLKEFGKTVLVKHDNGLVTVYGNADDILVERGATVKRGQDIAKSGMTGETDVPVLHFEVRKDSSPVDPMKYLR